jgi:HSP20 family protein
MTLVRWKPFNDIPAFQDDVSRLFDEMWRRSRGTDLGSWHPATDLIENENEFRLVTELPGLAREDVKITINDNVVTLRGEKKAETESKKENRHHIERTYGAFERSFHLATPVDKEKVKARFDNGVLTVVLPKSGESRTQEINID